MKRTFLSFFIGMASLGIHAQECDIPLRPLITQSADCNYFPQVVSYLTNRVRQLTSNANGAGGMENSQFAIAVGYDITDKQIVTGSPTKIIYNVSLNMHIVDLKGQKVYASYSQDLRGIGDNETKSLVNTFQKINVNNVEIKNFVQQGKRKVIEYYDNNYLNIINNARAMAAMKNFDAAIYTLMLVPECCKGYSAVMDELQAVYQQFVNQHCNENLAQARSAWLASPNSEGAATASIYLSEIYPDAACYGEAQELAQEIKRRMGAEWRFMMRQWADNVSLERQRINAMRDISIAYANAQPAVEITNVFW